MRANRTIATPSPTIVPKKRCAIYTRKSTDEGLDQEYNSLEAQRDAGLAFIASQRHEGWIAVEEGYDDGGYSGAISTARRSNACWPTSRPAGSTSWSSTRSTD